MKELALVQKCLESAAREADEGSTPGERHRHRSRRFVEAVATGLRAGAAPNVRVFSKHCPDHRVEFGLNELLYDVLVCEVATTDAARSNARLAYVTRALWQIESEFAADSRQALFDFNKLVIGSAPNKLFIGPKTENDRAFLASLHPAAAACSGTVYAALVPHPSKWETDSLETSLWRASESSWEELRLA